MIGKVYIYLNTPIHTVSNIATITQMSHKDSVFEGQTSSKKNVEKPRKHLLRRAMTFSLRSQKKSPAVHDSCGGARLLHWCDCSKPVHNHFLKNLYLALSQLVTHCSLHGMSKIHNRESVYFQEYGKQDWLNLVPENISNPTISE